MKVIRGPRLLSSPRSSRLVCVMNLQTGTGRGQCVHRSLLFLRSRGKMSPSWLLFSSQGLCLFSTRPPGAVQAGGPAAHPRLLPGEAFEVGRTPAPAGGLRLARSPGQPPDSQKVPVCHSKSPHGSGWRVSRTWASCHPRPPSTAVSFPDRIASPRRPWSQKVEGEVSGRHHLLDLEPFSSL